jgi:hypothetical protein
MWPNYAGLHLLDFIGGSRTTQAALLRVELRHDDVRVRLSATWIIGQIAGHLPTHM